MPVLQWIGKEKVYKSSLNVPTGYWNENIVMMKTVNMKMTTGLEIWLSMEITWKY